MRQTGSPSAELVSSPFQPAPAKTIELVGVPSSELRDVLKLWDVKYEFVSSEVAKLPANSVFRRYVEHNRPGTARPIRSILSCVCSRYRAFALLERPYLDLEFWDSHTAFYGSSFSRYPVECERLHLFQGDEGKLDWLRKTLLAGGSEDDVYANDLAYCGYMVLRPTPAFNVGRTAIVFDPRSGECLRKMGVDLIPEEFDGRPFLKVAQPCVANLLSAHFVINAPEFIQQDPNLGHCATASLWVTTRAMARRFGTNQYLYGTITRQAIGGWNRDRDVNIVYDPTNMDSGLSVSEMRNALAATGANSLLTLPAAGEDASVAFGRMSHEIYSFIESELPVLLCLENLAGDAGHVVAAVGHGLPAQVNFRKCLPASRIVDPDGSRRIKDRHYTVSGFVKVYYAHDDGYGPYNRIVLVGQDERDGDPVVRVKVGHEGRECFLRQAMIPIPRQVRAYATPPLAELLDYFERCPYAQKVDSKQGVFVWRSLLVEGTSFKQSVTRRGYSDTLKAWYAQLHLPKYVWLYEACFVPSEYVESWVAKSSWEEESRGRIIVGEYLYDATCPSYDVRLIAERYMQAYRDYRMEEGQYKLDESTPGFFECYVPAHDEEHQPCPFGARSKDGTKDSSCLAT